MRGFSPRRTFKRTVALLILGLWMAPGMSAMVLTVHLAEGHSRHAHEDHHEDHHRVSLVEELALATVHGHHHSAAAPDHDHAATLDNAAGFQPHSLSAAAALALSPVPLPQETAAAPGARHRRAPPSSLFYTHCALLL